MGSQLKRLRERKVREIVVQWCMVGYWVKGVKAEWNVNHSNLYYDLKRKKLLIYNPAAQSSRKPRV